MVEMDGLNVVKKACKMLLLKCMFFATVFAHFFFALQEHKCMCVYAYAY